MRNIEWEHRIIVAIDELNNAITPVTKEQIAKVKALFDAVANQQGLSHDLGDKYVNFLMIHGENAEAKAVTDNARKSVMDHLTNPIEGQCRQHNPYGWAGSKVFFPQQTSTVQSGTLPTSTPA